MELLKQCTQLFPLASSFSCLTIDECLRSRSCEMVVRCQNDNVEQQGYPKTGVLTQHNQLHSHLVSRARPSCEKLARDTNSYQTFPSQRVWPGDETT